MEGQINSLKHDGAETVTRVQAPWPLLTPFRCRGKLGEGEIDAATGAATIACWSGAKLGVNIDAGKLPGGVPLYGANNQEWSAAQEAVCRPAHLSPHSHVWQVIHPRLPQ